MLKSREGKTLNKKITILLLRVFILVFILYFLSQRKVFHKRLHQGLS
jgi:hypothetical protein